MNKEKTDLKIPLTIKHEKNAIQRKTCEEPSEISEGTLEPQSHGFLFNYLGGEGRKDGLSNGLQGKSRGLSRFCFRNSAG